MSKGRFVFLPWFDVAITTEPMTLWVKSVFPNVWVPAGSPVQQAPVPFRWRCLEEN